MFIDWCEKSHFKVIQLSLIDALILISKLKNNKDRRNYRKILCGINLLSVQWVSYATTITRQCQMNRLIYFMLQCFNTFSDGIEKLNMKVREKILRFKREYREQKPRSNEKICTYIFFK